MRRPSNLFTSSINSFNSSLPRTTLNDFVGFGDSSFVRQFNNDLQTFKDQQTLGFHQALVNADLSGIAQARGSQNRDPAEEAKDFANVTSSVTPVASDIRDFIEFKNGQDLFTGKEFTTTERVLTGIGLAIPIIGGVVLRRLAGTAGDVAENTGVRFVDEVASMSDEARLFESGATGARTNAVSRLPQAPAINRTLPNGNQKLVKFDGVDGNVLIDRKLSVVTSKKGKNQAQRQSQALLENGLQGRWEVPNEAQRIRAENMFKELGINNIDVEVVK